MTLFEPGIVNDIITARQGDRDLDQHHIGHLHGVFDDGPHVFGIARRDGLYDRFGGGGGGFDEIDDTYPSTCSNQPNFMTATNLSTARESRPCEKKSILRNVIIEDELRPALKCFAVMKCDQFEFPGCGGGQSESVPVGGGLNLVSCVFPNA
jgi:hypothetical protein